MIVPYEHVTAYRIESKNTSINHINKKFDITEHVTAYRIESKNTSINHINKKFDINDSLNFFSLHPWLVYHLWVP